MILAGYDDPDQANKTVWLADCGDFNLTDDRDKAHGFLTLDDAVRTVTLFLAPRHPWFIEENGETLYSPENVARMIRCEELREDLARQPDVDGYPAWMNE
jgi:hypothetical protein